MDDRDAGCIEGDTAELLEELHKAAEQHRAILDRQAELIALLREELKGVIRDDT